MGSRYEYKTLVEYITPAHPFDELTGEEQRTSISKGFKVVCDSLAEIISQLPDPEGWEVNSHSISSTGDLIVISFLLQRLRV